MAIRYIDTRFFESPFVRGLKGASKTLYCFIICNASGAGIWAKDLEVASLYTGFKLIDADFEVFIKSGKAIDLKNGKYFFPDFIEHQYPKGLSEKNPAQVNFIKELLQYNLLDKDLTVLKTLKRPFEGSQVTVPVIEEVKEEEKAETKPDLIFPFDTPTFLKNWELWKQYKKEQHKFTYKHISEQAALKSISNLSSGNEEKAIQIIHQSINNGWKGFFELKNNSNGNNKTQRPILTAALEVLRNASGNKPE